MLKIIRVVPNDDYILLIELSNSHTINFNLKPRLKGVRFCSLCDKEKFKEARVENNNTIVWDSLCQITLDEIISQVLR